jgi:hypothetical protein
MSSPTTSWLALDLAVALTLITVLFADVVLGVSVVLDDAGRSAVSDVK